MSTNESLVKTLREQIDQKHLEAVRALETLSAYLSEAMPASPQVTPSGVSAAAPTKAASGAADRTRVEKVLHSIVGERKNAKQIAAELGLKESAVRAVLYAKNVAPLVDKQKIGTKQAFIMKTVPVPEPSHSEATGDGNLAAHVRKLLSDHPKGLRAGEIHAQMRPVLQKLGGDRRSIGRALYSMKRGGKLLYDGTALTYRLSAKGSSNGSH